MSRLKLAAAAAGLLAIMALANSASAQAVDQGIFVETDGVSVGSLYLSGPNIGAVTFDTGTLPNAVVGLGEIGTTVYGESSTGTLYTLTIPLDGSAPSESSIGSTTLGVGVTFIDFGSTASSLYAISSNGYLYDINSGTGAIIGSPVQLTIGSTPVGNLTRTFPVQNGPSTYISMSTGSSTLYFTLNSGGTTGGGTENIYTIDTTTGALTLAGTAGTGSSALSIGGMTTVNGTFYGGCNRGCVQGSLNYIFPITGSAPNLGPGTTTKVLPNPNKPIFLGLAGAVPEPSSWALMLMGVAAVGGAMRSRRRKGLAAA